MAFTVQFYEVDRYPKKKGDILSTLGISRVRCAWEDRNTLANELYSATDGNNIWPYNDSGATVFRVFDEPYPGCEQRQDSGDSRLAEYDWALVTIFYATWGPVTPTLVSERITPFFESQTMDYTQLNWRNPDNVTLVPMRRGEAPQKLHVGLNYDLTYHQLGTIPANLENLTGKVNDALVVLHVLTTLAFPAETLLYRGATVTHSSTSSYRVGIHSTFKYNDGLGWNASWRVDAPGGGAYKLVYDDTGGQIRPYGIGTFAWP